jgi:hypothetical protein
LNEYIQEALKVVLLAKPGSPEYFHHWGHWIPQYDFFFHNNDQHQHQPQQMVHHLLHNEYLNEEFDALMQAYGLNNITLPKERKKSRADDGTGAQLNVADLTLETIKLIEVVYEKDFEIGNYPMLSASLERERERQKNQQGEQYKHEPEPEQEQDVNKENHTTDDVQQQRQRRQRRGLLRTGTNPHH